MAFNNNNVFPIALSFGAKGGAGYMVDVVQTQGGAESRNDNWAQQLARYEVGHNVRTATQFALIDAHLRVAKGRANGFPFKDWRDYSATAAQGIWTLITSTTFQAYKRYTSGSVNHDRIITKFAATPTITGGTVSSFNANTGIVTMTSGTPLTWASPLFYVPCRYDIDNLFEAEILDKAGTEFIIGWQSIPIVEIRDIA